MIHIVDYGLGNIGAFLTLYKRQDIPAIAVSTAEQLAGADHILLPGVGSFDHAMELLNRSGMRETLDHLVLEKRVPVLGVCVGMQILGDASEEGTSSGLGWIPGHIRDLGGRGGAHQGLPLPHMGWNDIKATRYVPLLADLVDPRFYFLHSFYFDNQEVEDAAATAEYGTDFTCIVNRDNVWGVQFHPEKSHSFGMALLKNFASL
ncbi:imidazole glycerol phosphate synthase subunit HisH [Altererythrobacter arenosus]|uniref:Imidazole glycerol phosphate synthase subunit HisH n=1 Tax=Altererythrobacter arenosus TaxID=3032592 RepID=A0ABY8FUP1_9SPHN|nr:imidazole glycerol phosphate synthase subunit HisH [Altererythrobacter sp. CAU 1644]WFL78720.1 imidazole glycerol phosphate synthase subunit HisH [Altererythrobacter sp. CAU 1644]